MTVIVREGAKAKKRVEVRDFLRWVFREELPKGERRDAPIAPMVSNWESTERSSVFMEKIDDGRPMNIFGVVGIDGGYVLAEPHADALACYETMKGIDREPISWPDDWNPLAEYGDLQGLQWGVASRVRERMFTRHGDELVLKGGFLALLQKWAILDGEPDGKIDEAPRPEYVRKRTGNGPAWFIKQRFEQAGAFGALSWDVEADGYDAKRKRPKPGAYRKQMLVPDPLLACEARAEYELWCDAMRLLAETLDGKLEEHELSATMPERPWLGQHDAPAKPRVLPTLIGIDSRGQLKTRRSAAVDNRHKNTVAAKSYV